MREYFPFLGNDDRFTSSIQPASTQAPPTQSTAPTGKTLAEGQTRPGAAIRQETEKDGLLLRVEAGYVIAVFE